MRLKTTGGLKEGEQISTTSGDAVKIIELLGEGGQGEVYKVLYKGKEKALKWYTDLGKNPDDFRQNLKDNIEKGSPNACYLWPQALTEWKYGSFGYIMELLPKGYYEMSKFMIGNVHFNSWKTAVDAALNMVMAFRLLHNKGRSYQDLNPGNFFIQPNTGEVLIGDNDNIAPTGENMGILGKPRYIAPEIVRGENLPDTASDRYSLAVLLFIMFCYGHPLEGKTGTPFVMTPENSMVIYGTHPVFVFDPKDDSNRPIPGVHNTVLTLWNCLPSYMQDIFRKAFSQESLMKKRRVIEYDWLKALARFRSDIRPCPYCGNEVFLESGEDTPCDVCGKLVKVKNRIAFSEYRIPAEPGSRIYRIQLGTVDFEKALDPVAVILANPQNRNDVRIRNLSDERWNATTPSGKSKQLQHKEMAPVKAGISFVAYGEKFEIQ